MCLLADYSMYLAQILFDLVNRFKLCHLQDKRKTNDLENVAIQCIPPVYKLMLVIHLWGSVECGILLCGHAHWFSINPTIYVSRLVYKDQIKSTVFQQGIGLCLVSWCCFYHRRYLRPAKPASPRLEMLRAYSIRDGCGKAGTWIRHKL